jgi:NADH-quinone oxidoreductase subunit G
VLPVVANHNVPRGVVWAPFNQSGTGSIEDIIDAAAATTDVRIERI